jgi:GNAT superfamily N-acetyltransferase
MNEELNSAIEVFVQAIAKSKSQYGPYFCRRLGEMWVLHDDPTRKDPRKTEVVTTGKDSDAVVEEIRKADLGWHFLCDIQPNDFDFEARRSEYKALGYRAMSKEWMFVHDLVKLPEFDSSPAVRMVTSQAEANGIPQIAKHKLKLQSGSRDFWIWDERRDYGAVRSIDIGDSCWVQGLHVHRDVRRRGYGKALMSALLQSDASLGRQRSVLLASTAGSKLYPLVGYRQIGVLQMFCPVR